MCDISTFAFKLDSMLDYFTLERQNLFDNFTRFITIRKKYMTEVMGFYKTYLQEFLYQIILKFLFFNYYFNCFK